MAKKDLTLVEEFRDLEQDLLETLEGLEVPVNFSADKKTVMAELKAYILQVKNIDVLFAEYEKIAEKIEALAHKDAEKNEQLANAVVGLREDSAEIKSEIEELRTEIENIGGEVKVKQNKKKKNNSAVKEF